MLTARGAAKQIPFLYRRGLAMREHRRRLAQTRYWPHADRLPAHAKRELLRSTALSQGLRTLIETGTYEGETVYWLRGYFDRIVTIEREPRLHELACRRLAPYRNIEVLQGDSVTVLPSIIESLQAPALFWLDSHGCTTKSATGGSPAARELDMILDRPLRHVVLIDDARLLGGEGWPTLDDLRGIAFAHGRDLEARDDIVRVALEPGGRP